MVDILKKCSVRERSLKIACIAQVTLWENLNSGSWRIWKLIPVQDEGLSTGSDDKVPPEYSAKE